MEASTVEQRLDEIAGPRCSKVAAITATDFRKQWASGKTRLWALEASWPKGRMADPVPFEGMFMKFQMDLGDKAEGLWRTRHDLGRDGTVRVIYFKRLRND